MRFSEYLPIGTVVLLNDAQKRLMIIGVGQTDFTNNIDYDYIGVVYPEGSMGEGTQFLFNQSDIDQVFFRGYEDPERDEFISTMEKEYDGNAGNQ